MRSIFRARRIIERNCGFALLESIRRGLPDNCANKRKQWLTCYRWGLWGGKEVTSLYVSDDVNFWFLRTFTKLKFDTSDLLLDFGKVLQAVYSGGKMSTEKKKACVVIIKKLNCIVSWVKSNWHNYIITIEAQNTTDAMSNNKFLSHSLTKSSNEEKCNLLTWWAICTSKNKGHALWSK